MTLKIEFVKFLPDAMNSQTLYISREWQIAGHVCPCGCGGEVYTSLKEGQWQLAESDGKVTLSPSIGNQFSCRSHYWIRDNAVVWA